MTFLLVPGGALAQAGPDKGTKAAADKDYLLGIDDVIEVTVTNHDDLDRTLTILPNGKINYPGVGEITAAGRTSRAVAEEIRAELDKTLNNFEVVVSVKEVRSRRVRVIGAVKAPGGYDMKPTWRVVDLLAVAGGPTARVSHITGRLIRGGSQVVPLDIARAMAHPEGEANVPLQPDDLLLLDEVTTRTQVSVQGQVNRPGAYDVEEGDTVVALLSRAGNCLDDAALSKAYVLRGKTEFPLDLRPLKTDGKLSDAVTTFQFQNGDELFVPQIKESYTVMGEMNRRGVFAFPEQGGVTVLQAYQAAGQAGAAGDPARATIVRQVKGKATVLPVNIEAMVKKGDMSRNVALQPGDILYVPLRGGRHGVGFPDILQPIGLLSVLGLRVFR